MLIKALFYSCCWNVDQRAFLLRSELLKCWSKGFSTSIWTVEMLIKWLFYFDCAVPAKSQHLGLGFKWWGLCGPAVFDMCDFHLFLLDLDITFLSRKLWLIFVVLWKRFDFWNLKLGIGNWKFWIWNLKFENLPLEILRLETWNLKLEVFNFDTWKIGT